MGYFKEISVAVAVFGIAMVVLRMLAYSILRDRDLLKKAGSPRFFFFSDALPIRLLFLRDVSIGGLARGVFFLYALSWIIFVISLAALIISFVIKGSA